MRMHVVLQSTAILDAAWDGLLHLHMCKQVFHGSKLPEDGPFQHLHVLPAVACVVPVLHAAAVEKPSLLQLLQEALHLQLVCQLTWRLANTRSCQLYHCVEMVHHSPLAEKALLWPRLFMNFRQLQS